VFVVLRLYCQLKVVREGSLLILSKSGIEHTKEPLRRARVRLSAPRAAQIQSEQALQSCTSTNHTTQTCLCFLSSRGLMDFTPEHGI